MPQNDLLRIVENMRSADVLVVGDIMLDRFLYGHVERISPEGPVPVLALEREEKMLGGAGNALANLAGLGAMARVLALVGEDAEGRDVESQVAALGFRSFLIKDHARPTIVKTRFLAGHQQLLRTDFERKHALGPEVLKQVTHALSEAMRGAQAVVISDYGKGLLAPELLAEIIKRAASNNIPVIVDPKGSDFSRYRGATAVTPNKKELSEATSGHAVATDADVIEAARTIVETCGIGAVFATRSAEGITLVRKDCDPVHIRGADIEVFDVSGAGDAVIATVAAALAAGATLEQAAGLANLAGSIVVTKVGTAPVRAFELIQALQGDTGAALVQAGRERRKEDRARRADILGWDEAAEQVRRWKARGLKVGFTNGCFDILHKGHVSYLNNARDHCDRLIVALNSDASVKILKGPERPVHDEDARASVLAALGSVDLVTLFGAALPGQDNTAIALLEALKPDIYFKGGDYTEDQIPEAPTVRRYGGTVSVMPVYEGHSTTGSIQKMKSGQAA